MRMGKSSDFHQSSASLFFKARVDMSVAKSKTAAQCIGDCINSLVTKARLNPQLAALAATGAAASLLGVAALAGCFQKRWDVTNKVFIITGASSGIGKALALQLVQMGAKYDQKSDLTDFLVLHFVFFEESR